jgi:tetratricopeptide (TPR) repeat protein
VDEALVLKGLALSRLRQCQPAVAPLARASLLPPDADVTEEAYLALGRCQLELGDPAVAEIMFARLAESEDPVRRREASLLRGRALRLTGRGDQAVETLQGLTDPRAEDERLLALAAAHRRDDALALADSMLATRDSAFRWDTVTSAVGREDPLVASSLVDRLVTRPGTPPTTRAQLLFDDGIRLASVDTARAEARLRQTSELEEAGDWAERARLRLLRGRLARATSVSDLPPLAAELDQRVAARSTAAPEAGQLRDAVARVRAAADSAAAGAPQADLRLFLAGEVARDSLAAPALAGSLFRMLVETAPDSPYAPKAILAGKAVDPVWGESALPLLEERYALSPYVAFLRGDEPYGYRELEDSLQIFASGLGARPAPAPGRGADSLPGRPGAPPVRRGLEP